MKKLFLLSYLILSLVAAMAIPANARLISRPLYDVRVTDPITSWQKAFSSATTNSSAGDPPVLAQFQGGVRKATLEIDYSLSDNGGTAAANLVIYFYNSKENTFTEGVTVALEGGKHNIKLDIKGRSGGLKLANMTTARVDWLYFTVLDRETGGN